MKRLYGSAHKCCLRNSFTLCYSWLTNPMWALFPGDVLEAFLQLSNMYLCFLGPLLYSLQALQWVNLLDRTVQLCLIGGTNEFI